MSGKIRILRKTEEDLLKKRNKARKDQNIKVLATVQKDLGDLYFEIKQYENALDAYKEQLSLCKNLGDEINCAVAHRMIGEVYADIGNFEEALKHQNLYLDIAAELKNLIEKQRAYATLGRTYLVLAESFSNESEKTKKQEALDNSKSNFIKSIKVCEKLDNKIEKLELQIMRARLLLNLGLVLEHQKDYDQALHYMEDARSICEASKINDDTLYKVNISLSNHYERKGDVETAFKNLDDAAKTKDEELKIEAEVLKAELFLRLGKWPEARKILRRVYNNAKMLDPVREQVARLLKITIVLCRNEDELLLEDSISIREKLFESLGDAAVAVKSWSKAIEYYSEMLSCAEKTQSPQLCPALSSLFQTLRDAGRVQESIPYARRELELCKKKGSFKDACNSALFLTTLLSEAGCPRKEIREMFDDAWELAKQSMDAGLERLVLKDFIEFLGPDDESLAERLSQRMDELPCTQSSCEPETETESPEIGADIDLNDMSDDESDGRFREPKRRRAMPKKNKPNELGESVLHQACIKGDITAVEKLLEERHPTAVRDYAGWTPLHEASNHGYVEIVKLLIDAGAKVNDPGGINCDGITALHDAASNGHLAVMQLLLDRGADPSLLTKQGQDALDCLIAWRNRENNEVMSDNETREYNLVKQRLKDIIKAKGGKKKRRSNEKRRNALYSDDDDEDDEAVLGKTLDQWSKPERISAGEDYKQTMKSLKHPGRVVYPNQPQPKITAPLIDSEEMLVDSWLEDDLGRQRKDKPYFSGGIPTEPGIKRKSKDSELDLEKNREEKRLKRQKLQFKKQLSSEALLSPNEDSCDSSTSSFYFEAPTYEPEKFEVWPTKKKNRQTNLLKQGFTKNVPSPSASPICVDLIQEPSYTPPIEKRHSWEGITEIHLTINVDCETFNLKLHSKDLRKTLGTIESLIRHLFEAKTGCRPRIKFQTLDGVALDENITLEEIPGDKNELTLIGCIMENDLPDVLDRYNKICESFRVEPSNEMLSSLKSLRNSDRIPSFTLNPDCELRELEPLIKCLHYQKIIKVLNLSGARFYQRGESLNYLLKGLPNLTELFLQNCDVDEEILEQIDKLPTEIRVLDLAYNPLGLGGRGHKKLFKLLEPLDKLQKLNLRACRLESFEDNYINSSLIELDISWNPMDGEAAVNLLQRQLLTLKLANTRNTESKQQNAIDKIFYSNLSNPSGFTLNYLESLDLSSCEATDYDVDTILSQTPNLMRINLSCNKNVTKYSLGKMLTRKPSLSYINLNGCGLVDGVPEDELKIVSPQCCELQVDMNPQVIDAWEKLWEGKAKVKKLPMKLVVFKPL